MTEMVSLETPHKTMPSRANNLDAETSLPIIRSNLKKERCLLNLASEATIMAEGELDGKAVNALPQSTLLEPTSGSDHQISEPKDGQCNGDVSGRGAHLTSELFEMEPETMEFKPVTSGPPRRSPLITAVRRTQSQPVTATDPVKSNLNDRLNGAKPVENKINGIIKSEEQAEHEMQHVVQSKEGDPASVTLKLAPGVSDPSKTEDVKPPNGVSLHPWSQRNGVTSGTVLSKGNSLSHENLRSKLSTDGNAVAVSNASTPTSTPLSSGPIRGSLSMDPKDPFGIETRLGSRNSSGRLSASELRGKIQDMPWYLTRSQEILGTAALQSSKSVDDESYKDSSERNESKKESAKARSVPALNDWKEKDAEVVVVRLKDGPQEVTTVVKDRNENVSLDSYPDLRPNGLFSHLGSCKSEQPRSQINTTDGLERPSPPSSNATPQHDMCGCRNVYTNCFSGDQEDLCGFDDDLTVYEFSRQKRVSKPPQPSQAPSHSILSLLRDSPRPLSTSSELSPLVTPPRPRPSGPMYDPLRDLQNRRYVTGLKGTGLKGGYVSLHKDIDALLVVLKNGEAAINPSSYKACCEKSSGMNGNTFSETERCLVQAEARRLASGCQRATRVGWAPDDALLSLGNSFGALVHLAAACLQISCSDCGRCHGDVDGAEALQKLQEIVCLYKEFVTAVETAQEAEGVRLLAKQCTVLISTVFSLTQLFRTHTPDTDNRSLTLNF